MTAKRPFLTALISFILALAFVAAILAFSATGVAERGIVHNASEFVRPKLPYLFGSVALLWVAVYLFKIRTVQKLH